MVFLTWLVTPKDDFSRMARTRALKIPHTRAQAGLQPLDGPWTVPLKARACWTTLHGSRGSSPTPSMEVSFPCSYAKLLVRD